MTDNLLRQHSVLFHSWGRFCRAQWLRKRRGTAWFYATLLTASVASAGTPTGADQKIPGYALSQFTGFASSERAGAVVAELGDVNGDGMPDFAIASPEADYKGRYAAGRIQVVFGRPDIGSLSLEDLMADGGGDGGRGFVIGGGFRAAGLPGNGDSGALSALGDLDGDGADDFAIGVPSGGLWDPIGGIDKRVPGRVYIVYGRLASKGETFPAEIDLAEVPSAELGDSVEQLSWVGDIEDYFGTGVVGLGDFDGDGHRDIAIAAPGIDRPDTNSGAVFVYFGNGQRGGLKPGFVLRGEGLFSNLGRGLAAGTDLNGDGHPDLIACAPSHSDIVYHAGVCYVLWGGSGRNWPAELAGGSLRTANGGDGSLGVVIDGGAESYGIGSHSRIINSIDLNHDGRFDLVFASAQYSANVDLQQTGRIHVLYGRDPYPVEFSLHLLDPANGGDGSRGFILDGAPRPLLLLGYSLAPAGDVNRDGLPDLLIGAPGDSLHGGNAGRAYVVFGRKQPFPLRTVLSEDVLAAGFGFAVDAVESGNRFGELVTSIGDIDGDGRRELLIGAPNTVVDGLHRGIAYYYASGRAIFADGFDAAQAWRGPTTEPGGNPSDARLGFTACVQAENFPSPAQRTHLQQASRFAGSPAPSVSLPRPSRPSAAPAR